ncbi:transporter substrate-binding domain-containing protein [Faecalicoccus pleomorphus]|uniref:transporter substrate-binding domain-containing protein n=1 Tax=Faecalicoccus pleomorphus TaxID=1323 RepID=UPI0019614F25|nr:transporter substrate-binding domain-containing protein [Faecalicoccus pleomorphus]MBM6678688.1 transporter substrate-binding domain-containing protein [Faecalicoccus pleomorphus]
MKKLLAALAVGTLALAGCSSGTDSANDDTFTVGMECGYQPFNWQTSDAQTDSAVEISGGGGYCDGYDVMMSQAIADELGQKLEVKKISWDGLQPALDSGEIDAIVAGMTASDEREEGIDFTTPYYESEGMVMIVRADSEMAGYTDIQDFSGHKVIGQKNTNYDTVIDQIEGVDHQTPLATYPELVAALQNGVADGITAEMPVAEGVVAANPGLAIVQFEEGHGFDVDTTVSIGLKEGTRDSDFFKSVQDALDSISQDTRNEYMKTAVENAPTEE